MDLTLSKESLSNTRCSLQGSRKTTPTTSKVSLSTPLQEVFLTHYGGVYVRESYMEEKVAAVSALGGIAEAVGKDTAKRERERKRGREGGREWGERKREREREKREKVRKR